jgi:two-component system, NarL family, nitrate/nitrite response regulator NarL
MHIHISDDHHLFRDTLAHFILRAYPHARIDQSPDFNVALRMFRDQPQMPDLVLLDLQMPGMHGVRGFSVFRDAYPDTPVVLMSGVADAEDVRQVIDLGARGYFPKTMSGRAMLKAIDLVLAGERFVPLDPATNWLMPAYQDDNNTKTPHKNIITTFKLTPRERDVLELLCRGLSNKDISEHLGLQIVTIKLHIRGICRKLSVTNRTQAALKASSLGIVTAIGGM